MKSLSRLIIMLSFSTIISTQAFAATDFQCLNDCTRQGYMYGFCQSKCSYNNSPSIRVDFQCVNNCTSKGYMYSYCQHACSY